MNTKTDGISSGLVAVAWQVRNGWSSCDLYRTLKSATEDRDMLQKRADFAGNLMAYRVEPLVRLSDAEAIIAQKDAEILEQCRINGMGAEREATLLGKVERQSAALKLAKEALTDWLTTDLDEQQCYEALAALAEQNAKMRGALTETKSMVGHPDNIAVINTALSLPNLATPILNKIKAEAYREAAMHCSKHGSRTADEVSEDLFANADELEQSK